MLGGRPFTVVGLAVTAAWPAVNSPGLIWLTEAETRGLITKADPVSYWLNLKLADPAAATAFANARGNDNDLFLYSWQQISVQDSKQLQNEQFVLVVGTWLLSLLARASVAVLVGGRMAEQKRRVGLIKAVGGTPNLVALVLLAEYLALALLAAAVGLAVGWLATPLLSHPHRRADRRTERGVDHEGGSARGGRSLRSSRLSSLITGPGLITW